MALAKTAIDNISSLLNATVVRAITDSLGVIGIASWAISALENLNITSLATPAYNSFGADPGPGHTGDLVITVGHTGGFDWPAGLAECASDLNVMLPSLNSVLGRTVTWSVTQVHGVPTTTWCTVGSCDLATEDTTSTGSTLGLDHTATFAYRTNTETSAQATAGGLITDDFILVNATASLDTAKLQALLSNVVLGGVPGAVRVVVGPMFGSLTSAVVAKIAALAQPSLFRYVRIEHHGTPCLVGNWKVTSVGNGQDPGTGSTWDWGTNGVWTADYNGSEPNAGGSYFTGVESDSYTLAATDASGTAGTFGASPLSGGLTSHIDGHAIQVPNASPQSGQWSCSGDTSTITEPRGGGSDITWTADRQAS